MAQLRSVNIKIWDDPWFETLDPQMKLLFLYLITCPHGNLAGIYEITTTRIAFETKIDENVVIKGLKIFQKDKKIFFLNQDYILLINFLKNQNLNTNMKKGVLRIFNNLPTSLKEKLFEDNYKTVLSDYVTTLEKLNEFKDHFKEVIEDPLPPPVSKKKPPEVKKDYSNERTVLNAVAKYFNSETIKKLTPSAKEEWLETIRKLHTLDKYSYDDITETIIFARKDEEFWKDNVLSIPPLRNKKKGDVSKFAKIYAKKIKKVKDSHNDTDILKQAFHKKAKYTPV